MCTGNSQKHSGVSGAKSNPSHQGTRESSSVEQLWPRSLSWCIGTLLSSSPAWQAGPHPQADMSPKGHLLSQSRYANFREVPAFLSKIAHSSHLMSCLLLCFLPSLSVHRSGQSQTWRKFPLRPCVRRLMPAAYLSGQGAPTDVLPKEPPSLFRDEMADFTVFPVWLGHEGAYCLNFTPILSVFHLCLLWECVCLVEMPFFWAFLCCGLTPTPLYGWHRHIETGSRWK